MKDKFENVVPWDRDREIKHFMNVGIHKEMLDSGEADRDVMQFIAEFMTSSGRGNGDVLYDMFQNKYCFYFAVILKTAFNRGEICVAAPYGHIVWKDTNGVTYDSCGISIDYECLIPVEALGTKIQDFMHVPGKTDFCTEEDVKRLMEEYKNSE